MKQLSPFDREPLMYTNPHAHQEGETPKSGREKRRDRRKKMRNKSK